MKRRNFLKTIGGGIALSPWLEQPVVAAVGSVGDGDALADGTNVDISSLFE